ncbi:5-oxoprolinase (ATP-hydrolyzing) [Parafrankia sp. EUN1f]|nr:5-oxoprolinase (ATP-hydrolyzing) [Parafrankia sp. EUN1f]
MHRVSYVVGVDIGGTFTDCVAIDPSGRVLTAKALSTHASSPVVGVMAGLEQLARGAGESLDSFVAAIDRFSHGTTIGTNLVVERNGARVGVVATRGHGDALSMMRGRGRTAGVAADLRANVRDTDKPVPIVPRRLIAEVPERVTRDGTILAPLDEDSAREVISDLIDRGVDAISIALLWSFRNPEHELRLRELVHEIDPRLYVSLSSEIAPRQGEYERTVATVINSYVGPASSRYLTELAEELSRRGIRRAPFIMQSNGGVLPVAVASRLPIQTIGSGPAGGLAGTATIARRSGHQNVIATDMGGTSFEVGLLIDGRPILSSENVIEQYTFKVSQLDVRSIACGGGSIAQVDPHSGGLRVGPESAGSSPGPACYGFGSRPTVTDADVVLRLLDPDEFLGGRMELNAQRAADAVQALADQLGLSLEETASGILRVNNHNAATLIRQRTIEQGVDPRDFTVYAFGGAGPVHAFHFAEELGADHVVIPMGNGASTLSAYGIAASNVMQVFERECSITAPFDLHALGSIVGSLEDQARAAMREAGFSDEQVTVEYTALARYAEQYLQELELSLPPLTGDPAQTSRTLTEAFRSQYKRLFGEAALAVFQTIEIFAIRVTARVDLDTQSIPAVAAAGQPATDHAEPARFRNVFWPGTEAWRRTAVYEGAPPTGQRIYGPSVVQLAHTSISVAPGQHLETDAIGNVVLTLRKKKA